MAKTTKKEAKAASPKKNPSKTKERTSAQKKKSAVKKSIVSSLQSTKKKTTSAKKTPQRRNTTGSISSPQKISKRAISQKSTSKKSPPKKVSTKKSSPKKPSSSKKTPRTQKSIKKSSPKRTVEAKRIPKLEFPKTNWGGDSVVTFEAIEKLPPAHLTFIAGGFVFHEDKLVLANIPGRGWEIIGGRIDIGESPEQTFQREAENQIGVILSDAKMIGVIKIEHKGPEPPNCPYPYPVGYGVQFIGIAEELLPFRGGENSLGRSLITQEGFKEHYYEWDEFISAIFKYAYSEYKKWMKKKEKEK